MSTRQQNLGKEARLVVGMIVAVIVCAALAMAQTGPNASGESNRSRAVDRESSRAERHAEELVALSADTIVDLLRKEPGLLLQAKRALVRQAYRQGRLVNPRDLDDDLFFRLVQADPSVRALITHEIESRYYIRAKPTEDELERGRVVEKGASRSTQNAAAENQEGAYWSKHEGALESYPAPGLAPLERAPEAVPNPPAQGVPLDPARDRRRQLDRAESQPFSDESTEALTNAPPRAPRLGPEESSPTLPGGLNDASLNVPDLSMGGGGRYSSGWPGKTSSSPWSSTRESDSTKNNRGATWPALAMLGLEPQGTRLRRPGVQPDPHGLRHRPNPYADVPSLYDLYSQYSQRPAVLERFGADVFRNGTGNSEDLPMDMPVGPEYVLGPGDGVNIELWGGVSQRLQRVVDREGRVALPEVGVVEVSGRSLGEVQRLVQKTLRTQFRDVEAAVSLARLRTVRVYVVGDVERPGAYDVSSLSTPLNALYLAGGPTARGSLRTLRHFRGKLLLQEVDVYDLLLHGVRSGLEGLQPGDTILVPPLGAEVTVEGMVRRPAVYEIKGEKSLAEVLELAGGVLHSGTLRHVDVERIQAHLSRTMLRLEVPEDNNQAAVSTALEDFQVQEGDQIKISAIVAYADKTVYLDGHVVQPGKLAYREGMKVTDLIRSYADLLPEPYERHAEIIRLNPPDSSPTVVAFNLKEALAGQGREVVLKPFDTVRIFGRYDFEDPPLITIDGEVRDPGDHLTNGVTYLRDAVYLAGGTTLDAQLDDAQVFRKTPDGKLKVLSVNLSKAIAGDGGNNILLQPADRVFIHRNLNKMDPPAVKIEGEVAYPGKYPLGEGMTAAELVRVAGGFKRGAYTELADLTRYEVEHHKNVTGENLEVPIAKALAGGPDSDVRLHDGDVLTIRQLGGWNDVGATIEVKGEVGHPGTYGIRAGERLSSILARAGGLQNDAYPYGIVFERAQVRAMEESNRTVLIREVQDDGTALQAIPDSNPDDKSVKEASLLQWQRVMERLKNTPPSGRLVLRISKDIKRWANTPADIEARAGDVLYVPKHPSLVMVDGAVYNPTAVSFKPGKDAGWYLRQAGGPTNMANQKAIFVIRADGSVAGGAGGLFTGGVSSAQLQAGDMVVVPEKAFAGTTKWRNTLQVAQLLQAVALSVSLGKTF
jgi:protein involved in polysaccharide export with SLBB domain